MGAVPKATLQGYITECSTYIEVLCDQSILALYWTSFSSYNTRGGEYHNPDGRKDFINHNQMIDI